MEQFERFKCHTCGAEADADHPDWGGLPTGWLSVMSRDPDTFFVFCGWACMRRYNGGG